MKMRIVFATDFHLSNRLYGLEELEKDFYSKFQSLVDKVINEKPDLFIQLGDIFDTPYPRPIAIKTFQEGLDRLNEEGIRCYGILGNHTLVRRRGFYPIDKVFKGMTLIEDDCLIFDDVFIGGIGYHSKFDDMEALVDELYEKGKDYRVRILLLHQSLKEDIGIGYDFDEDELALRRFDYVFLGHFHKRVLRRTDDTVFHYIGSLNSCNVSEMMDEMRYGRGYTVFDTDDLSLEMKSLEVIHPFVQYNLNNLQLDWEIVDSMVESLKEYPCKPIVQLNFESNDAHDIYKMINLLEEYALLVKYKVKAQDSLENHSLDSEDMVSDVEELLRGCFDEGWKGDLAVELFNLLKDGKVESAQEVADTVFRQQYSS